MHRQPKLTGIIVGAGHRARLYVSYAKDRPDEMAIVGVADLSALRRQQVAEEFGCTATLNMIGGCSKPSRSLHLIGTIGEIQGCLEDSRFVVRHIDPRPGHEYREEVVDLNVGGDITGAFGGHGGGDMRLVADFLKTLRNEPRSIYSTVIEDSVAGHLMGFARIGLCTSSAL